MNGLTGTSNADRLPARLDGTVTGDDERGPTTGRGRRRERGSKRRRDVDVDRRQNVEGWCRGVYSLVVAASPAPEAAQTCWSSAHNTGRTERDRRPAGRPTG